MNELRLGLGVERGEPREDRLDLFRRELGSAFPAGFARRGFVSFAFGSLDCSCAHGRDITGAEAQDARRNRRCPRVPTIPSSRPRSSLIARSSEKGFAW